MHVAGARCNGQRLVDCIATTHEAVCDLDMTKVVLHEGVHFSGEESVAYEDGRAQSRLPVFFGAHDACAAQVAVMYGQDGERAKGARYYKEGTL